MGFDSETTKYPCGCYSEWKSHDFFNYTTDHIFVNVCGNHETQDEATKNLHTPERISQQRSMIEDARADLVKKMKSDKVIHYLRIRNIVSRKQEDELLQIPSNSNRTQHLNQLIKSEKDCLLHIGLALIKSGQIDLVKYLREIKSDQTPKADQELMTSYDGRCMLHIQYDCYVVAKEYKDEIYIHLRNYEQKASGKCPTKKGVALTLSRWLMLELKKNEINELFSTAMDGKLTSDEEKCHLGGGVYVTISKQYPTVDIRHFWKPDDSNTPIPTKKGIALNKSMWERICDVMDVIRDFVPELNVSVICYETHRNEIEVMECDECSPFEQKQEYVSPNQEGNFQIMSHAWTPETE